MKNKTVRKITLSIVSLFAVTFLMVSCSKKNDSNAKPASTSHKVIFKATASAGSNILVADYGYDGTQTTASSLSGTTWTSPEITAPAGSGEAVLAVNGNGVNASSTLQVQIYVDGTLVKTGTASGATLTATAQYNF